MEPWNFSFKSFGRVLDRNSVTVISDFHVFSFFFLLRFYRSMELSYFWNWIFIESSFHRPSEKSNSQWNCIFALRIILFVVIFLTVLTAITIPHESFSQIWISSRGGMMENTRKVFVQLTIRVPIYAWHWEAAFAQEEGSFLTIISAFKAIDTKNSVFMQVFQNAINCIACSASIFTIPC